MTTLVLYQYAPGGCFKQLSDAAGSNVAYSQYAPGGPAEQLRVVINPALVLDQHAPSGVWGQAIAAIDSSGGNGGSAPAWVPANAKIHIDFLGGTPQGRAWSNGAGVAIDTLLGSDPNTVNGWGTSSYDPAKLTVDGYLGPTVDALGFIGAARSLITRDTGVTLTFELKQVGSGDVGDPSFALLSADGVDALECDLIVASQLAAIYSWNGEPKINIPSVINLGDGVYNKVALTMTLARLEGAFNGSAPTVYPMTTVGRPPDNSLVAALLDTNGNQEAFRSITIYDPLPDTTGLSELSMMS